MPEQYQETTYAGEFFIGYSEFVDARFAPGEPLTADQSKLLHAALGVAGEAGELVDAVKKSVFYKQPLDVKNVIEECGDILFYVQALLLCVDESSLVDSLMANIEKLNIRYSSGKFSTKQATARADKQPLND